MSAPTRTRSRAWCITKGCTWGPGGTPWEFRGSADAVDLEARRHSGEGTLTGGPRPGHGTNGLTEPIPPP